MPPVDAPAPNQLVVTNVQNESVRLDLSAVLFVESEGKSAVFYEADRRTVTRMRFADVLLLLPADQFMRVHKAYAINLAHIHKIEHEQVLMGDKLPVPLTPGYRDALRARVRSLSASEQR